jgi:hypothetical protein
MRTPRNRQRTRGVLPGVKRSLNDTKMTGTVKRQLDFREALNQDAVGLPSLLSGSREIISHNRRQKVRLLYTRRNNPPSIRISPDFVASQARILFRGCLPILETVMEE